MSGKGRLVMVIGTRPDFLKMGPIAAELRALGSPLTLVKTGQHTSLLDDCPAVADLTGGLNLGLIGHPDPLHYVVRATAALQDALDGMEPVSAVIVQGDTGTTLAGARAAKALGFPIAHVEAGLRSGNDKDPWPEEGFRKEISSLADFHYCPTALNAENLASEGITKNVCVTGNSIVSAVHRYCPEAFGPQHVRPMVLITLHRREFLNQGHFKVLQVMDALFEAAAENSNTEFVWPVHPSLRALLGELPLSPPNVVLRAPFGYREAVMCLAVSHGVITDSGGITEEATTLGVPLVVLRQNTDRPEAKVPHEGPSPESMTSAVQCLLEGQHPRTPNPVFGTPQSAAKIASLLHNLT